MSGAEAVAPASGGGATTPPPRGRTVWRRLSVKALPALAVMLAVLLAAWLLQSTALEAIEQARLLTLQAQARTDAALGVLSAVKDAETGQRGFLLTMEAPYLAPYRSGEARVGTALAALAAATAGMGAVPAEVAALQQAVTRKMAELAETIQIAQQQGAAAARATVRSGTGRADMDAVRALVGQIVARTSAERESALSLLRRREREAAQGLAVAAVCGALLLGGAVIVLLIQRDRSQRAQDAERLQSARLAATVEQMRDGVAVFDAHGRLLLSNAQLSTSTGWAPELLRPGASLTELVAAAAGWPGAPLARLAPGAPADGGETQMAGRVLDLWHSPMPDGGQMLTVADITRRTQAEAVARQAQKIEALGQLTGGIAHDFNNLLQVMSANLELVSERLPPDPPLQRHLAAAQAAIERAARLTRHLLAFARRQPLAPRSLDPRALLTGLEDVLRRTLGERIAVEMVLGGGLWPLRADPQQLESAVLNLAINARDAMPQGGRLMIEAANAALDDDYAAANAEVAPGHYVLIAVSDTGTGMTPEQLGRALEPFYTTKPEGRGTGLGLPMVYGFAKQSAGHFKLYSEPGRGTTARLYIPRSATAAEPPPRAAEATGPASGELVLVVEDDPAVRAAAAAAVRGFGYRVAEASGTAPALAALEAGLRPDLLFTDVVMPGQPGVAEMVARARAALPGLAIVYTSGYTENAVVHNGRLDPDVILVSKPWRGPDLARKLTQALRAMRQPLQEARPLRVLLVEDEMLVRMTTADLLADFGYEVIEAESGAAALDALDRAPDVLLTDLGLPDIDGMDLAARARERLPGLRVIIASGRDAAPDCPYVVLEKPYDQAAMRGALVAATSEPG